MEKCESKKPFAGIEENMNTEEKEGQQRWGGDGDFRCVLLFFVIVCFLYDNVIKVNPALGDGGYPYQAHLKWLQQ